MIDSKTLQDTDTNILICLREDIELLRHINQYKGYRRSETIWKNLASQINKELKSRPMREFESKLSELGFMRVGNEEKFVLGKYTLRLGYEEGNDYWYLEDETYVPIDCFDPCYMFSIQKTNVHDVIKRLKEMKQEGEI